jgi:hypothetical protein
LLQVPAALPQLSPFRHRQEVASDLSRSRIGTHRAWDIVSPTGARGRGAWRSLWLAGASGGNPPRAVSGWPAPLR